MTAFAAVYHYHTMDITLMTDEDENRGSELWPSAENIVSYAQWGRVPYMLTT